MLQTGKTFPILLSFLLAIILIAGCGGDNSTYSGVIATATPPPVISAATATPVPTVMAEVSGYVYTIPSTDPEGTNGVIITDVPVNTTDSAGNASLVSQVSTYLQSEEPTEWATSNCQEAYNQLTTVLSGCQPATGSSVTTSYSDPNSAGLSVNAEGYFSGQLPVVANQSNVELEVATNEDEAYDVETITSSGLSAYSTSGLECCPKRIIALPGDIALFEVHSSSENLKSSKLKFTLNPDIGYVCPPIYLCVFGKNRYTKAYSFVYFKRNLDTPTSAVIMAKTNTGLSLDIPVEVVKSTASISGKVFTSKQLIKGYVKSLGPKAYCKLDSSGNYSLPKVYKGHDRKIVAVYWVMENGKKVKHKQVKVIDFFNADVTGFNFGEEATPTPTATETPTVTPTPRRPLDQYYTTKVSNTIYQFKQWKSSVGTDQAIQDTVDWLNGKNQEIPVPEGIQDATIIPDENHTIWINFKDGMGFAIDFNENMLHATVNKALHTSNLTNKNLKEKKKKNILSSSIKYNNFPTVRNTNILIIDTVMWELQDAEDQWLKEYGIDILGGSKDPYNAPYTVSGEIVKELRNNGYNVTHKVITKDTFDYIPGSYPYPDNPDKEVFSCNLKNSTNMVRPEDFKNLDQYGIIYFHVHGSPLGLDCGIFCENDEYIQNWIGIDPNSPIHPRWFYANEIAKQTKPGTWYITFCEAPNGCFVPHLFITPYWIGTGVNVEQFQDFRNSIIIINACAATDISVKCFACSTYMYSNPKGADICVFQTNKENSSIWGEKYAYYLFHYMMYGFEEPNEVPGYSLPKDTELPSSNIPMSAMETFNTLNKFKVNPDPFKDNYPKDENGQTPKYANGNMVIYVRDINKEIYFPAPAEITIKK